MGLVGSCCGGNLVPPAVIAVVGPYPPFSVRAVVGPAIEADIRLQSGSRQHDLSVIPYTEGGTILRRDDGVPISERHTLGWPFFLLGPLPNLKWSQSTTSKSLNSLIYSLFPLAGRPARKMALGRSPQSTSSLGGSGFGSLPLLSIRSPKNTGFCGATPRWAAHTNTPFGSRTRSCPAGQQTH